MSKITIGRGESLPLPIGFSDNRVIGADWVCRLQIRKKGTKSLTAVDRYVTTKNEAGTRFTTLLTNTESSTLEKGEYNIGFELSNPVTGESKESNTDLTVTEEWVYD